MDDTPRHRPLPRRAILIGALVLGVVVVLSLALLLGAERGSGSGSIDGSTVEAAIEADGPERGLEGLQVECPDRMTPRDGYDESCRFATGDGSSGGGALTWDGDAGDFTCLIQLG